MEEQIKQQNGSQFVFSNLKIRTMQDDLKKHTFQDELPPSPAPSAQAPTAPPAPKETIKKELEQAPQPEPEPKIIQKIISRTLPEPPPYLPSEPAPAPQGLPTKNQPIETPTPKIEPKIIYKEFQKAKLPVKQPKRIKFALIFGVSAAVVILGISGFIYYRFWGAPKPLCPEGQINASCSCGGQTKTSGFCCNGLLSEYDCFFTKSPGPLIETINLAMNINAQGASSDKILSDIVNASQSILNETARIVALKMSDSPKKYATLDDLIRIFGITLPENLKANTQSFNLLVYIKPGNTSSPTDPTKEIRLVLVLSQKDSSPAGQTMSVWETTMLNDMKPLILGGPSASATANFVSTNYNGGFFRYKNLPTKTATINYTIYQNLVIIGTSKNSVFYVYDSANINNPGAAN